jgi:hypothetical protein
MIKSRKDHPSLIQGRAATRIERDDTTMPPTTFVTNQVILNVIVHLNNESDGGKIEIAQ